MKPFQSPEKSYTLNIQGRDRTLALCYTTFAFAHFEQAVGMSIFAWSDLLMKSRQVGVREVTALVHAGLEGARIRTSRPEETTFAFASLVVDAMGGPIHCVEEILPLVQRAIETMADGVIVPAAQEAGEASDPLAQPTGEG